MIKYFNILHLTLTFTSYIWREFRRYGKGKLRHHQPLVEVHRTQGAKLYHQLQRKQQLFHHRES